MLPWFHPHSFRLKTYCLSASDRNSFDYNGVTGLYWSHSKLVFGISSTGELSPLFGLLFSSFKASLSAAFNILTVLFNVLLLCCCTYVCNIRKHTPYISFEQLMFLSKKDNILIFLICKVLYAFFPQHFLYFLPEPHGHGSFRPIFLPTTTVPDFFCSR